MRLGRGSATELVGGDASRAWHIDTYIYIHHFCLEFSASVLLVENFFILALEGLLSRI